MLDSHFPDWPRHTSNDLEIGERGLARKVERAREGILEVKVWRKWEKMAVSLLSCGAAIPSSHAPSPSPTFLAHSLHSAGPWSVGVGTVCRYQRLGLRWVDLPLRSLDGHPRTSRRTAGPGGNGTPLSTLLCHRHVMGPVQSTQTSWRLFLLLLLLCLDLAPFIPEAILASRGHVSDGGFTVLAACWRR